MIKAEHKKWARFVFNRYIDRLLRKNFSHFYMINKPPEIPENYSLIVTPNHISWWDGFFIDFAARKFIDRKLYLMMLESSLKKYPFFNKVGAYSIDPGNNLSVRQTASYTKEILSDIDNFVVTYPQGEIEPFEKRPLNIKEGLRLFAQEEGGLILPAGFKIQYYNEKLPSVICRFGELMGADVVKNNFKYFNDSFTANLDLLHKASYEKLFQADLFNR